MKASDGTISGYAWSDNIGWVSANSGDLASCPQSPCTAKIKDGAASGWLKALAADDPESGGWDGWISLDGVTQSGTALSGYGWGGAVVGWVDFAAAIAPEEVPPCESTQGYFCSANVSMHRDAQCAEVVNDDCSSHGTGWFCSADVGLCAPPAGASGLLVVSPMFVGSGGAVSVSWDVANASECGVTENSADVNYTGGPETTGADTVTGITETTTFTLTCVGNDGESFSDQETVTIRPEWREL